MQVRLTCINGLTDCDLYNRFIQ